MTAGRWPWKSASAKECVTTHPPNPLASKTERSQPVGPTRRPTLAVAAVRRSTPRTAAKGSRRRPGAKRPTAQITNVVAKTRPNGRTRVDELAGSDVQVKLHRFSREGRVASHDAERASTEAAGPGTEACQNPRADGADPRAGDGARDPARDAERRPGGHVLLRLVRPSPSGRGRKAPLCGRVRPEKQAATRPRRRSSSIAGDVRSASRKEPESRRGRDGASLRPLFPADLPRGVARRSYPRPQQASKTNESMTERNKAAEGIRQTGPVTSGEGLARRAGSARRPLAGRAAPPTASSNCRGRGESDSIIETTRRDRP